MNSDDGFERATSDADASLAGDSSAGPAVESLPARGDSRGAELGGGGDAADHRRRPTPADSPTVASPPRLSVDDAGAVEPHPSTAPARTNGRPRADFASFGCGQQSMALLILTAAGHVDVPTFMFANVGDEDENPKTLAYYQEYAAPFARDAGIELVELRRRRRNGDVETLGQRLEKGSMAIPVRRSRNGKPMSRSCTADFKVRVLGKEMKRRGWSEDRPATVAIGISVDELSRAKPGIDPKAPEQNRTYPLLALGLHRSDCQKIIRDAGLPVPPKSSCWFCPLHDREAWRELKRDTPRLFAAACGLERSMSERTKDGRPVYLTRAGVPLDQAIDDQFALFGDDCESGYCMT